MRRSMVPWARDTPDTRTMHRRDFSRLVVGSIAAGALPRMVVRGQQQGSPKVNGERLNARLAELSRFGRNPQGGVTRLAYSDADRDARAWIMPVMREARLEPVIDVAGNIVARRAGSDASLKPIVFGSHIDSVPEGGNYDGNVGSLAAIEVAQTLSEQAVTTRHPLDVVIWQNEEGGLVGSRSWVGELTEHDLTLTA